MCLQNTFDQLKDVFLMEKHRIDSFQFWPFDESTICSKQKMAEAGFYWTGTKQEPDTATCFTCNKTLDGWEATDDPWKEHAKHAPQCVFVKLSRAERHLTVREFIEIVEVVLKTKLMRCSEKRRDNVRKIAATDIDKYAGKKT